MFDTQFTNTSSSPLDVSIPDEDIVGLLHDFGALIHLNPDCKGYHKATDSPEDSSASDESVVYDCEDAAKFVPKRLWDGSVWYKAIYAKQPDGCDITVKAPAGLYTSFNRWRLQIDENGNKSMNINSDATCNRLFAYFVERFTRSSHETQHRRFKEVLEERIASTKGRPA
ncbi:Hypothetical protein D9617_6g095630 [Elsinoe fawcettii]|nr:Hypothetical protein D9617_6g095630 [Elsinoe fawcettii]